MGLARRGREGRRRRCRDIDDDERQRDRPQPPSARRAGAGRAHLFVAPPRRCLDIDSSSRLDLSSVVLPTNVIVFLKVSTKMVWISRFLYFLLFLVGFRLIVSLLTRVLTSSKDVRARSGAGSEQARKTIAGQMIKDPQCGMYVATDLAVAAKVNGQTLHFCSEECRDHFINEHVRNNRTNRQAV